MKKRLIAGTSILLSQVTFGSMRFLEHKFTEFEAINFLSSLYDAGMSTVHSSHEYESHPFFCSILNKVKKEKKCCFEHIVKIAVPHFNAKRFDQTIFRSLIEQQLVELGTDRIEVVQWLLRHDPNTDDFRLPLFEESWHSLNEVCKDLVRTGKVGALSCFPYTQSFAQAYLAKFADSGLTDYLNIMERERILLFDQMKTKKQHFIAIRPLNAGLVISMNKNKQQELLRVSGDEKIEFLALKFPLLHPIVVSEIVSVSSAVHLNDILKSTAHVDCNETAFKVICDAVV